MATAGESAQVPEGREGRGAALGAEADAALADGTAVLADVGAAAALADGTASLADGRAAAALADGAAALAEVEVAEGSGGECFCEHPASARSAAERITPA
jgi:hypothetical protein